MQTVCSTEYNKKKKFQKQTNVNFNHTNIFQMVTCIPIYPFILNELSTHIPMYTRNPSAQHKSVHVSVMYTSDEKKNHRFLYGEIP